jgi:sec-independent protein translocase protein TatC
MTGPGGEMPFLDHLEELRMRILRSLGAVVLAFAAGLWIVQQFDFVTVMKGPIAPYLPDGRLTFTSPTEPLMITLKLGFVLGLVLASPVIIWQVWAFLSPALYERERKLVVPALVTGMLLFLTGAALGWVFVVPQALRVFFGFQAEALQPMITYDNWFGFVMQIVLALGLSFELPLVIIILAALGIATPQGLHRFRRFAVVGSFIAGAILSPGADVFSMLMMTVPLLLLYEVGFAGTVLIHKRRLREALKAAPSVVLLLLGLGLATPARAQEPVPRPPAGQPAPGQPAAGAPGDTTRGPPRQPGQPMDSALAARLGLPTAPSQQFQPADSAYSALLGRPGYTVTKFRGDTAALLIEQGRLELRGRAMTDRQDAIMEAETITYEEDACALEAEGDPKLFSEGQVLVGEGLRYDTCRRRGVVTQALTKFEETGTTWFIRGNVAKDSVDTRMFAGRSELTSCDLPTPHYHFAARRIKWISKDVLVARPIILYIRDVPILWLPFLFQDLRPGRHSGILIPQIGLNDIVRTNSGYRRQIANIGYYWATNDYMDATFRFDWFSGRYIQYGAQVNYRVLNRFMNGSFAVDRTDELDGGNNLSVRWEHQQRFSLRSSIALSLNFVSNSQVVNNNAIDPILNTQNVNSSIRYEKRFAWGNVNVGANARQNLSDDSYSLQLPALTVSPKPIALGRNSTWAPGLSITNDIQGNQRRGGPILGVNPDGSLDSLDNTASTRTLTASLQTPVRLGNFNWANSLRYLDRNLSGRDSLVTIDSLTGNPTVTYFAGNYQSELDWDTGINLPILFRTSWKLQPTLGITNTTAGPFAIRNRNTSGDWVVQGKRPQFSLSATPTFFAFFGGGLFGVQRIRHSINPLINWSLAPSADVSEAYARAIAAPGQQLELRSRPQNLVSLSLQQNFEAKARPAPEDTLGTQARKFRLLSIQTSAFAYDFERAKDSGATGWITQSIQNNLLSDLLPGFNVALGINLWRGVAGTDTATFKPFVQTLNANFSLSSRTFQSILGGLGLGAGRAGPQGQPTQNERNPNFQSELGRRPIRPGSFNTPGQSMLTGQRGFTSSFSYTLQRIRQDGLPPGAPRQPDRQNLQFSAAFSPTAFWAASVTGQYNLTDTQFESIRVQLERDLHEWRAAFSFTRNANGNVAFFFSVFLTDLPDLRWDYQQTTFEQ